MTLEIPDKLRRNAALMGEAGQTWLADLPQQLAELERRWRISVGQPFGRGSEAFVAEVRTDNGQDAVVKIVVPGIDPQRQELRILRAADGVGYARLIRGDEALNAMLLEKLGAQLHGLRLPEEQRIQIICATLREAWLSPLPEGPTLPTGADKAVELSRTIEQLWLALGRPCSERLIKRALSYADRRRQAFDPAHCVLAHGDAHEWNTLGAPGSTTGFKFVDPDGACAERAFDLAVPMREWGSVIPDGDLVQLGRQRCTLLARFAAVEPQPVWEWGLVQCAWNGLMLQRVGFVASAAVEFALADAWSASGDFAAP